MASLTAATFLLSGGDASTAYSKLVDISEYPDLGSSYDSQDVTTLSDACHKYIDALPDPGGSLEFPGFLNDDDYDAVQAIAGQEQNFVIAFGGSPTSADSTILEPDTIKGVPGGALTITPKGTTAATFLAVSFKGKISVRLSGAGSDAARPVTYTVIPTTGFTDQDGHML
jgi:hypothetical protein